MPLLATLTCVTTVNIAMETASLEKRLVTMKKIVEYNDVAGTQKIYGKIEKEKLTRHKVNIRRKVGQERIRRCHVINRRSLCADFRLDWRGLVIRVLASLKVEELCVGKERKVFGQFLVRDECFLHSRFLHVEIAQVLGDVDSPPVRVRHFIESSFLLAELKMVAAWNWGPVFAVAKCRVL